MVRGRTASAGLLPIVTIRHPNPPPILRERVDAARTINPPGGLKPAGPNWLGVVGIQLGYRLPHNPETPAAYGQIKSDRLLSFTRLQN